MLITSSSIFKSSIGSSTSIALFSTGCCSTNAFEMSPVLGFIVILSSVTNNSAIFLNSSEIIFKDFAIS